ncbi:MAG: ABC transporter permease, partial [Acetivibrio ethanolgignens]
MIKKLSYSIREYKKNSILAPIYVTLEVVMEVIIPLLMAKLIDYGIDKGNLPYIIRMGIFLFICAMVSLFFGVMAGNQAATASAGFAKNLRQDMYYKVQTYSFSNIDRFSTASIITRLTTDVTNVQNAFQMLIRIAVRSPIMLIFSLVAAFRIDSRLSLIFLGCVPILGSGLWIIMQHAHPIFERVFKTYDRLNGVVQENLRGIRVVKSFVREDFEEKKFGTISERIYQDFSRAEKTVAFNMPLMQLCMYSCMILISWFGARAVVASGKNKYAGIYKGEHMSLFYNATQILGSM